MKLKVDGNSLGNNSSSLSTAVEVGHQSVATFAGDDAEMTTFPKLIELSEAENPMASTGSTHSDATAAYPERYDVGVTSQAGRYFSLMMILLSIRYDRQERSVIMNARAELFEVDVSRHGIHAARLYLARDAVESIYPLVCSRVIWCLETIGLHAIVRMFFG